MNFVQTTATQKLQSLNKRLRGVAGGSSASKTISILLILIDYAQSQSNKVVSIVSESMPHLKKGAMRDFLNIMQSHSYYKDSLWNKTDSTYTFETNSIIEFFGVESWEKVKGARRDVLFINEANHITFESFTQMEIRTKEFIWLDWNPEAEFWFYTDVIGKMDCDFITLTYKDNEALDPRIVESLESRRGNKNWWRVYGEGQLGEVENQIYSGWQQLDDIPYEARLYRYGLDFGYSNDPTAIVAIYQWNGGYILDEICYQIKLFNKDIADVFLSVDKALIKADSAEPKSVDELYSTYHLNIVGANKGKGSVLQGIQFVQAQKVWVTRRSVNLWKEYHSYLWMTDQRTGKNINEPSDILNHAMDAIRYGLENSKHVDYSSILNSLPVESFKRRTWY